MHISKIRVKRGILGLKGSSKVGWEVGETRSGVERINQNKEAMKEKYSEIYCLITQLKTIKEHLMADILQRICILGQCWS